MAESVTPLPLLSETEIAVWSKRLLIPNGEWLHSLANFTTRLLAERQAQAEQIAILKIQRGAWKALAEDRERDIVKLEAERDIDFVERVHASAAEQVKTQLVERDARIAELELSVRSLERLRRRHSDILAKVERERDELKYRIESLEK